MVGRAELPSIVVTVTAVPDLAARPFPTSPLLPGATHLAVVPAHLLHTQTWMTCLTARTTTIERLRNHEHRQAADLQRWSRLGESNPRPTHYECVALTD